MWMHFSSGGKGQDNHNRPCWEAICVPVRVRCRCRCPLLALGRNISVGEPGHHRPAGEVQPSGGEKNTR